MTTKHNAYIETMKKQLDDLNASLNKIEAKTQEAKGQARNAYFEEMRKLRHQSKLAVAKFEEIKLAGEDTWDSMVAEMDKLRDAFTHSFHYFKSQA
jgi:ribosome recycling factor